MTEKPKCPVCGETDPFPAWFCLLRIAGVAVQGESCSYSVEGAARSSQRMRARFEAEKPA